MPDARSGSSRLYHHPGKVELESGRALSGVDIAYDVIGTLNDDASNTILICHATTGDQYVANGPPHSGKSGWWERMVGPGKPVDSTRYHIICVNILGSCMGSTGPGSIDPDTGKEYAMSFPLITIGDMVECQKLLLDHLGIQRLHAIIGPSMGGMQALEWAVRYPDRASAIAVIAATARHAPQNMAFHEVGRRAIMADPKWRGGDYYGLNDPPVDGLGIARMIGHLTYLSDSGIEAKFGRGLQDRDRLSYSFDADFAIESYLRHQGQSFTDRFDANSYLYITRAMNYFDLGAAHGGSLADALRNTAARWCVISFDTDWLFPTAQSKAVVHALNAVGAAVSFAELRTPHGHDGFLLDLPELSRMLGGFLRAGDI